MKTRLRNLLSGPRRFWADTRASLSIEAAIMLPLLCGL